MKHVVAAPPPAFKTEARTLCPKYIGKNESGWTITGKIHEDYCIWVNDFEATHPSLGWVRGNFETVIEAKSKKAYDHFVKHHPCEVWDYWDI